MTISSSAGRWGVALMALVACQPAADVPVVEDTIPEIAPSPEEAASAPQALPAEPVAVVEAVDTIEARVGVQEASCVPGRCVCVGTAERSAGLWRVSIDLDGAPEGVPCLVAELDGDGVDDYVLLGGEGFLAAVMHGPRGPYAVLEIEGLGMPELYQPRGVTGPGGEPVSESFGIFVPRGNEDAYFVWNGEGFEVTVLPVGRD